MAPGRGTMSVSLALLVILAAVASGLDDARPRVGKQFRDEERKKYDIELTFPVDGDDANHRKTQGKIEEIQKLLEQIVLEGDSLVSCINSYMLHSIRKYIPGIATISPLLSALFTRQMRLRWAAPPCINRAHSIKYTTGR